jgi:hypothetical protein
MAGLQRFDNSELFCKFGFGLKVLSYEIRHDLIPSTLTPIAKKNKDHGN